MEGVNRFLVINQPDGQILHKYTGIGGDVTLLETTVVIGEKSFQGCDTLRSVEIPDKVTSIRAHAFSQCRNLTTVTGLGGLRLIDYGAFSGCTSLSEITLPQTLRQIWTSAFADCSALTSLEIPASVIEILWSAFEGCTGLTSITIHPGVRSIYDAAFRNCASLTSVELPFTVKEIAESTFEGCASLTTVTIPKSVTSIGYRAFRGCTSLSTIRYAGSPEDWDAVEKSDAEIPEGVTVITGLLTETEENGFVCLEDTLVAYRGEGGDVTVPAYVTRIAEGAFAGCETVTALTLPARLTDVGKGAFRGCTALTTLSVPYGIETIGEDVLAGCDALRSVRYPGLRREWEKLGCELPAGVVLHCKEETYYVTTDLTEDGKVTEGQSQAVNESVFLPIAQKLEGCLLKIEGSTSSSYDNSDDERASCSESHSSFVRYGEISPYEDSEALFWANGTVSGVIFRIKSGSKTQFRRFSFDGSLCQPIRLGYSASHSSRYTYIDRITLVEKGKDGAPEEGRRIRFTISENDPDW